MCGISAIKSIANAPIAEDASQLQSWLRASIEAMGHRGPDSSGTYISEDISLGLAHARLSIIDLEGGQQPLHDLADTVHAIVNGELYDYAKIRKELECKGCKFTSFVDSEVIVHLYKIYGQNFVHHLRGEFAFVLYDAKRDLLIAGRDRFGIKPLFHTIVDGKLLLASEMKALRAFGWKAEWDAESIVQLGYYLDNRTIFKGVRKLPPGHLLTCNRGGHVEISRYWDLEYPHMSLQETRTVDQMIEGVRERLVDAVRARLRSDVPLGVYLSGGLDSASVAGIASTLLKEKDPNAKLITFTLAFPGRKELDEGPIAQRMAESIGAEIHMVTPTEEDLVRTFPKAIYHSEQPTLAFHSAGKVILSEYVRNHGYKVVLTGEGSDETFGGYYFLLPEFLRAIDPAARSLGIPLPNDPERMSALRKWQGSGLRQDHISLRKEPLEGSRLARDLLGGVGSHTLVSAAGFSSSAFTPDVLEQIPQIDNAVIAAEGISPDVRRKMSSGQWHPLNSGLYATSKTLLSNLILCDIGDRTEMANSIEGRTPFLDHYLVEYVNNLPPSIKILPFLHQVNGFDGSAPENRDFSFIEKWVLRQAVKPFVTEEIFKRTKVQYNAPISRPSESVDQPELTPLQVMLKDKLTKEAIDRLGWARWEYVEGVLQEYLEAPECPKDGGLDKRARILLGVVSYVILQEHFEVPAWTP